MEVAVPEAPMLTVFNTVARVAPDAMFAVSAAVLLEINEFVPLCVSVPVTVISSQLLTSASSTVSLVPKLTTAEDQLLSVIIAGTLDLYALFSARTSCINTNARPPIDGDLLQYSTTPVEVLYVTRWFDAAELTALSLDSLNQ